VDITARLWPVQPTVGINPYASTSALLCHLLSHCAGNMRAHAFPGLEWSRSPVEALRYARSRILPSKVALSELESTEKVMPALRTIPWYGQHHAIRIVRWLFTRPPRVQTMRTVVDALAGIGT
jgi:hypothetical protein